MDDFYWVAIDKSGDTFLVHKTCAVVHIGDADEPQPGSVQKKMLTSFTEWAGRHLVAPAEAV